ncbi:MAG: hypothetical protein ABSB40_10685 [Nitrososphaeria archaeon]|jgi:hypothetical protein
MPIKKAVISLGKYSRAITLPKSWLEIYESQTGHKIKKVLMEVNGELKIKPYIERDKNG